MLLRLRKNLQSVLLLNMGQRIYDFKSFQAQLQTFNSWIHRDLIVLFICMPTCTLYTVINLNATIFIIFFLQLVRFIHVRNSCPFYLDIVAFMWFTFMTVYIGVLYIYIYCFVTGHHGRTGYLNGSPCMNILKRTKNKQNKAKNNYRDRNNKIMLFDQYCLITRSCVLGLVDLVLKDFYYIGLVFERLNVGKSDVWHVHCIIGLYDVM